METDDEIEIQVGADSMKISAKGDLARQVGDLVGSLTEPFGILRDKVRVYRELSLLRALKRASEIAKEEDLPLGKAPDKFLIHWMEGASMEDEADAQMTELWAKLLVSASKEFNSGHLHFSRIIREITSTEAKLIDKLVTKGGRLPVLAGIDRSLDIWEMFGADNSPLRKLSPEFTDEEFFESISAISQWPGIDIVYIEVGRRVGRTVEDEGHIDVNNVINDGKEYASLEILKSLGLIVRSEQEYRIENSDVYVFSVAYCITPIGAAFYWACSGNGSLFTSEQSLDSGGELK